MNKRDIEVVLEREVDNAGFDEPLYSAVKYVLSSGGKRLRPLAFLNSYALGGKQISGDVMRFAAGIECLHQYTLVHDDLPCMDDDELRRGKPTCHKMFGEANALLTGDALLNLAFSLMLRSSLQNPLAVRAAYEFSLLSGGSGVIGGQATELNSVNFVGQVNEIYYKKTTCLIWAAIYAGAIMGGLNDKQIEGLEQYARHFGFAFQVYDDLMDVTEKGEAEPKSFVGCFGVERAVEEVKIHTQKAIDALENYNIKSEFFYELARKMRSDGL